jgi:hypothetical protein
MAYKYGIMKSLIIRMLVLMNHLQMLKTKFSLTLISKRIQQIELRSTQILLADLKMKMAQRLCIPRVI